MCRNISFGGEKILGRRKSKKVVRKKHNNEIKGIILITIGILFLFSIYASSSSGIIGEFIKKFFITAVGIGSYLVPIVIIFIGAMYIYPKDKIKYSSKFFACVALLINTLLFIEMLVINEHFDGVSIVNGIDKIYKSTSVIHGGVISYLIDIPIYKLFGSIGSYIIFTAVYIICLLVILQISIYDVFNRLRVKYKSNVISNTSVEKEVSSDILVEKNDNKKLEKTHSKNNKIKIIDFLKTNEEAPSKKNNKEISTDDESIDKQLSEQIMKSADESDIEYFFPSIDLLRDNDLSKMKRGDKKELITSANKLEETLSSFGVEAKVLQVTKGPSVTRYELQPEVGVKVSKIVNLSDDIALNLAASGVRIEAPIPGKSAVGIEVPNKDLMPVYLREVVESEDFKNSNKKIGFCLGKDIGGKCVVSDLSKMPHLLVAGATGSGKSVCINALIISLLYKYSPKDVKLLLIDPKVVELSVYNGIPHLLIPVVTDPKKAAGALNWAVNEMTRRYNLFAENSVRNIEGYNELYNKGIVDEKLPGVVIIIDELADLMMVCPGDVEDHIGRLAQMARAAGMHLVIATQRPSVDVITGVIKANIPSRISFAVSSQIDSRTILDTSGAEKLLGKGDMLFYPVGEGKPIRIQGAFISEEEVEKVVTFIKEQQSEVNYKDEIIEQINTNVAKKNSDEDELLEEAINIVVNEGQASTSMLQRKLKIGYNRAAGIMEQLEDRGVVSGRNGSKPRQVLISKEETH
ncbi:DNA translocase FtsK 4TM domain-containing protein [Haloimpatiens sp. FM7330]|uniref:FtsK/SpoIIIE family DNA translocase n=1 Tax=Haloimpatiens sp. FM7330 TaxID=3298610 RepID=UPI003636CA31